MGVNQESRSQQGQTVNGSAHCASATTPAIRFQSNTDGIRQSSDDTYILRIDHDGAPQAGDQPLLGKNQKLTYPTNSVQIKIRAKEQKLIRFKRQEVSRRLLPGRPVARCRRRVGFNPETRRQYDSVAVMQSARDGELYTGRLWACKSAWECPVCQAYKAAVFLEKLLPLLESAHRRFEYGMETLTASSRSWMPIDEFVIRFKRAVEAFYSGKWRTNYDRRWHLRGRVTGHDITIGDNGPHYHDHMLIVADKGGFDVAMADGSLMWIAQNMNERVVATMWQEAGQRWVKCCAEAGLYADLDHGYHIQGANKNAAHYIAKLAFEVGLYTGKRGRGGRTMGELLDAAGRDAGLDDELAGRQWVEITKALKGSAYLRASKGLWELLGGAEPTKQESDSGEESTCDRLLAELVKWQWYQIQKDDKRQEWLDAQSQGIDRLAAWCKDNGF